MEPPIRYTRTEDGVNIGFCTIGDGIPLVIVPPVPISHVQLEWENFQHFYPPLADSFHVIWYDSRGSGASDRDNIDFSMKGMLRDLAAVISQSGAKQVVLAGFTHGALIAASYAVAHPEVVSHLVLVDGYLKYSDAFDTAGFKAERALSEGDWDIYTETMARVLGYPKDPDFARSMADYMRRCVSQAALHSAAAAQEEWDITGLLSSISVPTLVVHNTSHPMIPIHSAQALAASIPACRLLLIDDQKYERLPAIIFEFVCGSPARGVPTPQSGNSSGLRTVLFTDVVENTALLRRIGDEGWRVVMREHEEIVRAALKEHGGTEISTSGDGFFASFGSSVRALQCAIEMQRAFARRNETAEHVVEVRIGLNAGEPIADGKEVLGTAVTMAARVMSQAGAGEVLVSDVVRQLVAGKGFLFADRGDFVAKGFEEPVRVYEVRWRDAPRVGH
jgi:class 3 adenylate cyclase